MGKKLQVRTGSLVIILIVCGILAAVNIISQRFFARLDLTENKEYSISPATRGVLDGMDDVVNATVYFSKELPPYLANLRRQVRDILDEYRAYSKGKLDIQFVDPGDDPVLTQKVRALGIPQVQLEVLEKDQFQISNAYLGLALLYGTGKEVIPVIQNIGRLEYELTSALLRLTSPEKKKVGWIKGKEDEDLRRRGPDPLQTELRRLYEVEDISLEGLGEIPGQVHTLVLDSPREFPENARFAVDQFLMRGGRLIALVDHFEMQAGSLFPSPFESGVHDLLEHYGVKVNKNIVVEPYYNATASFSSGFMQFRVPYPFWVRVVKDSLSTDHPITAELETVALPWTSSLELDLPEGAGVKGEVLAGSSTAAWEESGQYNFSPQRKLIPPAGGSAGESLPLVVLLTGKFQSYWNGRDLPEPAEGEEIPALVRESGETSIMVVGTSQLAKPEFLQQFPEDGIFLLNAIDWMTLGQQLIGIRSRASAERTLPELPSRMKSLLRIGNTVGVPLVLAVFGLVRLTLRRRGRKNAA